MPDSRVPHIRKMMKINFNQIKNGKENTLFRLVYFMLNANGAYSICLECKVKWQKEKFWMSSSSQLMKMYFLTIL